MTKVLRVDASMRAAGSITRAMVDQVIAKLEARGPVSVTRRDLKDGVPFVNEAWIGANFTDPDARTDEQKAVLAHSDSLVEEIEAADTIVIATPVYNFGIPAALKAWVDMITRARRTFRYTENGPVGLVTGKRVYVVVASGGTKAGSEADFATTYLRFVLGFNGMTDVEVIAVDAASSGEAIADDAASQIDERVAA
ncbi:MAG: FMN-dependent NADH-azoreductase [Sphingomonadales bacterium]